MQVKKKYEDRVNRELDQFRNEIRSQIGGIWKAAQPSNFEDPNLETLTRKVEVLMRERFDVNPDAEESVVSKCVIVSQSGFRIAS